MKRVLTAVAGIPIALCLTWYAPPWLFALVVAVLACVCFDELLGIAAARGDRRSGRLMVFLAGVVAASFMLEGADTLLVLVLALMLAMGAIVFTTPMELNFSRMATAALGILYCGALPGVVVGLGVRAPMGRSLVVMLLGVVFVGDSAAYYCGRAFGRHPLAPLISPKKTVEGAIAGLAGSAAGGALLGHWLFEGVPGISWLALISLIAGAAGQIGDLAESALKRSAGVKDSSALLPGHGGMLDRLDSLLFAAPVFYWFFNV